MKSMFKIFKSKHERTVHGRLSPMCPHTFVRVVPALLAVSAAVDVHSLPRPQDALPE